MTEEEKQKVGGDARSVDAAEKAQRGLLDTWCNGKSNTYRNWIAVDNFALFNHPDSAFAGLLRQWGRVECQFQPLPTGTSEVLSLPFPRARLSHSLARASEVSFSHARLRDSRAFA